MRNKGKIQQKLQTILTKKNIKEKKRHEIEKLSQLTAQIADSSDVKYIVDFGAGLGHLARSLSFNFGLKVCCLEQDTSLTEQAKYAENSFNLCIFRWSIYLFCDFRLLDDQFERHVKKYSDVGFQRSQYLNICLKRDTDLIELVQVIFDTSLKIRPTIITIPFKLF